MKKVIKTQKKKLKSFNSKFKEECGVFGISKAIKYTGLGTLDSIFGLFFGFIRSYIIAICLFSAIDIVYNHDKWPNKLNKSYIFPYLEKGSNYLLKEFPDEKSYQDSKEKIEEL